MSNLREINQFIEYNNGELFVKSISRFYPLSENFVNKFEEILDWNQLILNTSLNWSDSFYKSKIKRGIIKNITYPLSNDLVGLVTNASKNIKIIWSRELILTHKDKLNWTDLSMNESLPWSIEFIDEFKEYWNWDELSSNISLPWSVELIDYFIGKWVWLKDSEWSFYKGLALNSGIKWTGELINYYWNFLSQNEIWEIFPKNEGIVWTNDLFEKYDWNLSALSFNSTFPWSEDFIQKNIKKLSWYGLTINKGLPWSENFFKEHYETNLYCYISLRSAGSDISRNEGIKWTDSLVLNHIEKVKNDDFIEECNINHKEYDEYGYNSKYSPGLDMVSDFFVSNKGIFDTFFSHLSEEDIDYFLSSVISNNKNQENAILKKVDFCIYKSKLSIRLLFNSKNNPNNYNKNYIKFLYDTSDEIIAEMPICFRLYRMLEWVRFMIKTSYSTNAINMFNDLELPYKFIQDKNGEIIEGDSSDLNTLCSGYSENVVMFEIEKDSYFEEQKYVLVEIFDVNEYLKKLYPILKLLINEEYSFANYNLRGGNYELVKDKIKDISIEMGNPNSNNEPNYWDSTDIRRNSLYDDNLDMDQQDPNIW